MDLLKSTEEFLADFDLKSMPEYFEVSRLTDRSVAFSVLRRYPKDFRFSPAVNALGEDDSVACIWVIYGDKESSYKIKGPRISVYIKVCQINRYQLTHAGHNYSDPKCPTQESFEKSQRSLAPLYIEFDPIQYDHVERRFFNKAGKSCSGIELLGFAYDKHCATSYPLLKSEPIRSWLKINSWVHTFLGRVVCVVEWILENVLGRVIRRDFMNSELNGYHQSDITRDEKDLVSIGIYKVPKPIAITTAVVTLSVLGILCIKFGLKEIKDSIGLIVFVAPAFSFLLAVLLDGPSTKVVLPILNFMICVKRAARYPKVRFTVF